MRLIGIVVCRILGTLLILSAVALWIYSPDASSDAPFRLIHIPGPEVFYQVIRWLVIAVLGGIGAFLWTVGSAANKRD